MRTPRRARGLGAVLVILLVAAAGFCLLADVHAGFDLCSAMLPAATGGSLVGLLLVGTLTMPPAPAHPPLLPARTTPAPV